MQRRSQRSVTEMRRTLELFNAVSGADGAPGQDLAEDAAGRHDAVAGEVIDGAAGMAFLADLADPQAHDARDDELVADGQRAEVDAARRQVLGEGSRPERDRPPAAGLFFLRFDVLDGQERDLPVAEILVGVALDAPARADLDGRDRALDLPLLDAGVDRDDGAGPAGLPG